MYVAFTLRRLPRCSHIFYTYTQFCVRSPVRLAVLCCPESPGVPRDQSSSLALTSEGPGFVHDDVMLARKTENVIASHILSDIRIRDFSALLIRITAQITGYPNGISVDYYHLTLSLNLNG